MTGKCKDGVISAVVDYGSEICCGSFTDRCLTVIAVRETADCHMTIRSK